MMLAVPFDCAEIPLLVVFTVIPFYVIPFISRVALEAPNPRFNIYGLFVFCDVDVALFAASNSC